MCAAGPENLWKRQIELVAVNASGMVFLENAEGTLTIEMLAIQVCADGSLGPYSLIVDGLNVTKRVVLRVLLLGSTLSCLA